MDREKIYQGIERCSYFRDIQLDKFMLVARGASTARATKPPKEGR